METAVAPSPSALANEADLPNRFRPVLMASAWLFSPDALASALLPSPWSPRPISFPGLKVKWLVQCGYAA